MKYVIYIAIATVCFFSLSTPFNEVIFSEEKVKNIDRSQDSATTETLLRDLIYPRLQKTVNKEYGGKETGWNLQKIKSVTRIVDAKKNIKKGEHGFNIWYKLDLLIKITEPTKIDNTDLVTLKVDVPDFHKGKVFPGFKVEIVNYEKDASQQ